MLHDMIEKISTTLGLDAADLPEDSTMVAMVWKSAAVVYTALTNPSVKDLSPGQGEEAQRDVSRAGTSTSSLVSRLLFLATSLSARCFCVEMVECLVGVWSWLQSSCSRLYPLVLTLAADGLKITAMQRLGIFTEKSSTSALFRRHDSHGANKDGAEPYDVLEDSFSLWDPTPHEIWIAFFENVLDDNSNSSIPATVFSLVEALAPDFERMRAEPRCGPVRFRLLSLGLRALKLTLAGADGPSPFRRRALRERIIACALSWFDGPVTWSRHLTSNAGEFAGSLLEFRSRLLADTALWTMEYPVPAHQDSDISIASYKAQCGPKSASTFLRRLLGVSEPSNSLHSDQTVHEVNHFRRQKLLGITSATVARALCKGSSTNPTKGEGRTGGGSGSSGVRGVLSNSSVVSGTFHLLDMFLLHELDRLFAWANTQPTRSRSSGLSSQPVPASKSPLVSEHTRVAILSTLKERSHDPAHLQLCVQSAWAIKPSLAVRLSERLVTIADAAATGQATHSTLEAAAVTVPLYSLVSCTLLSSTVGILWQLPSILVSLWRDTNGMADSKGAELLPRAVLYAPPAPLHVALDLVSRCSARFHSPPTNAGDDEAIPVWLWRYVVSCLRAASLEAQRFVLPQLVQLLRRDLYGALRAYLLDTCTRSPLICHQLFWLLQVNKSMTVAIP